MGSEERRKLSQEMIDKIDAVVSGHENQHSFEPMLVSDLAAAPDEIVIIHGDYPAVDLTEFRRTYARPEWQHAQTDLGRRLDADWEASGFFYRPAMHFDRQGRPCTLGRWTELMEDETYRRIAYNAIGRYVISTIWVGLGLGASVLGGPPLIFETLMGERLVRAHTEEEALRVHATAIAWAMRQTSAEDL